MKAVRKTAVKVQLTLSEEEAALLKGMMQNPLMEDEPEDIEEFREDLFKALS